MSTVSRIETRRSRDDGTNVIGDGERGLAPVFEASFEATLRDQDAPRAWSAINCLLAMTRLASANKLNSCASFLARPL